MALDWDNYRQQARQATDNINRMPFVLGSQTDPTMETLYPSFMQQGGVQPIIAAGQNIAPYLNEIGVHPSQIPFYREPHGMVGLLAGLSNRDLANSILSRLGISAPGAGAGNSSRALDYVPNGNPNYNGGR